MTNILEIYSQALSEYKAKNFGRALEILDVVKKSAPTWTKAFLLEAYIRREQNFYIEEISVIEKFLPKIDITLPGEKNLSAVAFSLLAAAYRNIGESEKAVKFFLKSAELEDNIDKKLDELSNAIFAANDSENFSAEDFQKLYSEYRKNLSHIKPYPKKIYRHEKIRVGYLSADFHEHPVTAFLWALIKYSNRNLFEVYCYSSGKTFDNISEKVFSSVEVWRDISNLSDEEAAKIIYGDEIDILFDLSGHTSNNRLPVINYRPATVQISGIGYMNSTGLFCTDYFLSDKFCAEDKTAMKNYFTEEIIELPHSHFCFTPIKNFPEPHHVQKSEIVFGCFNNFSKVTNSMLKAWQKILSAVPKSKLILKHKIFDNDEGKNFVRQKLLQMNFDLSQIELRSFSKNYLEEYNEIDIALDTFPYTGGVTTCEAIYMGVPVVSMYGDRHGTRFGYSILKNIGIEELAVKNFSEYVERAVMLAADKELLSVLHKNLRTMMKNSSLMNGKLYAEEVENFYLQILSDSSN